MKIGISTSMMQRGQTGVAQYVLALVRALRKFAGQEQFFLFVLEGDLPLFAFADGFELVAVSERFRPPVQNILWHQIELPRIARAHRLDVLHVPSYRRLIWPRPCALVATIHDLAPFRMPAKYDWKRMFYGRVLVKHLARRQDEVIAVSRCTARDLVHFFGISPKRLSVIHNGVDHGRFFPGDPARAKRWAADHFGLRHPFFLYIARLEHPAKNHVRLIDAFGQFKAETLSPWQLALSGSDWHGAEEIHRAIHRSPVAQDIHCLGFVEDGKLPELYRAADAFVYPSLFEGFGLPPLEAMACGCPTIASTAGSLGEVIGEAALVVKPEVVADIKEKLSRLVPSPTLRDELRWAGLTRARCFDWDKTVTETMQVYHRAAAETKVRDYLGRYPRSLVDGFAPTTATLQDPRQMNCHTPLPGSTAVELSLGATKTAGLSMTPCTQHESDSPNQTNRHTPAHEPRNR
ncbi:MAG: glycosyltransferase family 4 protein [Verrucomicrobiales bacterium]|nr:glycosyltransferase family 4 protein [Verrucomicrobiales bacterium]